MKEKKRTIGTNPLDSLIPSSNQTSTKQPTKPDKVEKQRLTVHIPVDLIDRVKNTVYWTPGLTLARLAEIAFEHAVDEMEKERGEPFPEREQELKGGRPLK